MSVVDFYNGKSIFITGGSGFVGKVLIEKLLSACPDLEKIYLLIRPSRDGKSAQYRLEKEILKSRIFTLRKQHLKLEKLVAIGGDISKPRLGLSNENYKILVEQVSIVFHSAATVRFQGPLKKFIHQNVFSTRSIMELCRDMKQLKAIVYVSTSYANCNLSYIEEKVYPLDVDHLIKEILDENSDETPCEGHPLLMDRPNPYTISKAIAESLIEQKYSDLPVVICRPSIVTHSYREPVEGWCDSMNGLAGSLLLGGLGIARTMKVNGDCLADIIPVDFVVNSLIVVGYHTSIDKPQSKRQRVIHITMSPQNTITWNQVLTYYWELVNKYPSLKMVRPTANVPDTKSLLGRIRHLYVKFLSQILFAYLFDLFLLLTKKQRFMIEAIDKYHRSCHVLEYFTNRQWSFNNKNYLEIYNKLNEKEKEIFKSDPNCIDWYRYFNNLCLGSRRYLINEDDSTIEIGRKRLSSLVFLWKILKFLYFVLIIFIIAYYFRIL